MCRRYVSIWFRYLHTDWFTRRRAELGTVPFVLAVPDHGRMVITSANAIAQSQGIDAGMVVADARAIFSSLEVLDDKPDLTQKLLTNLAEWCIRYSPFVAIDPPDGLILDATGCAHLWKGEQTYLDDIINRLKNIGYHVRAGMADTIGAAWAIARYGKDPIAESGRHIAALLPLPAQALRLEMETIERLQKLGLRYIKDFINLPRTSLRRRFGPSFMLRIDQATGMVVEIAQPVCPVEPYQERLPCLEPIATRTGIEIALERLLEIVCTRLQKEGKGLRGAAFKCFRIDGKIIQTDIGTNRATHNAKHLFKLFGIKLDSIEPDLGIEVFVLEAKKVEDVLPIQEKIWETTGGLYDPALAELLDKLEGKLGNQHIHRYLPAEHYWPERSIKLADSLDEITTTEWTVDKPRPTQLLPRPEPIEVTAPIPDYPPMLFRYKGKLHKVKKADGPERIEQEWWLQQGEHRDYYYVEDEEGKRYWVFRLGHYTGDRTDQWFMHGFFA